MSELEAKLSEAKPLEATLPEKRGRYSNRLGPKSCLDQAKQDRICAIIGRGCTMQTAADAAGVDRHTVYRAALKYPAFGQALREARSRGEVRLVLKVDEAAMEQGEWRAAAWLLTHCFRDRYYQRETGVPVEQVRLVLQRVSEALVAEVRAPDDRERLRIRLRQIAQDFAVAADANKQLDPESWDYRQAFDAVTVDPRYLANLDWGEARPGHPEGTVRAHIAEIEPNLERLRSKLSDEDYWKLKLLVHTHDSFKAESKPGVAITDPQSHASLARAFLETYCNDADLPAMVQYHDEPFALFRQFESKGKYNQDRFNALLKAVRDWNLFLAFNIIDGCTPGKSREPLNWLFNEVAGKVESKFTAADIIL